MKKIQFIFAITLLVIYMNSFATVRTVSNDPSGGAQYSTLQAAYNASANGDTILLEGTDMAYQITNFDMWWSKALTVIGIGFNPSKQVPRKTTIMITNGSGGFPIGPGGSGSQFYGITFTPNVVMTGTVNNVVFSDCRFALSFSSQDYTCTGFVFTNCIFDNDNAVSLYLAGNGGSYLITNCVLDGWIDGNNSNISSTIDHCLFLVTTAVGGPIYRCTNATIKNSILMNHTAWVNASSNCNFLNNIQWLNVAMPPAGNTGSGNLSNSNPNFVNYTLGSYYNLTWDFHLQAGSAAIAFATDGTDGGVHGGFSNFSEHGEPLIVPIIQAMNINNTTVAPNGTLNVQIHARKPKDN